MAAKDPLRALKIKTGVVKRLVKDRNMYILEVEENKARLEKMKSDGKDKYTIKKAVELVDESKSMVPDCTKRLEMNVKELQDLVEELGRDLSETAEYKAAKECLDGLAVG